MRKKLMLRENKAAEKRKEGKKSPDTCVLEASQGIQSTPPVGGLDRGKL